MVKGTFVRIFDEFLEKNNLTSVKEIELNKIETELEFEDRQKAVDFAKEIAKQHEWRFIVGRRGKKTRLVREVCDYVESYSDKGPSNYDSKADKINSNDIISKDHDKSNSRIEYAEVVFTLRFGCTAKAMLPKNISKAEVERFADFIRELPVD